MRIRAVLLACALATGCGGGGEDFRDPGEFDGELGFGDFYFNSDESGSPLNLFIGVDGTFTMDFESVWAEEYVVESASPAIVGLQSGAFIARSTGTVAMVARRTSDDVIVDFVHARIADVARVSIDLGSTSLNVGDEQSAYAQVYGAGGAELAGARPYEWSVSDPDVLYLRDGYSSDSTRVVARAPGTATLSVTTGDVSGSLQITVREPQRWDAGAPVPEGAPPDTGTDASSGSAGDGGTAPGDGGKAADAAVDSSVPDASGPNDGGTP